MNPDRQHAVLIVDDDEPILEMVRDCLSDLPYEILTASTAADAIDLLHREDVAVLICDLHMSGDMDGNQILATAHSSNEDLVTVLMSGRMDRDAMMKALNEGGVWRYLEKPLDMDVLRQVVEESITRYIRHSWPRGRLSELARKATVRAAFSHDTLIPAVPPVGTRKEPALLMGEDRLLADRYRLLAVLGQGGTGTVYRAEDTLLHMLVAMKVLHPQLTSEQHEVAILKEEARIAMTLSHRNIVRLHTLERRDEQYFLVMEYVEGCTLHDVLEQEGSMPPQWVILVARACASALSYAHEHGVIHQDLKPENLLLSDSGIIKIIDFGLACLVGKQQDPDHIAGTPAYMSPEQKQGLKVDTRTDIYSMGVILYELLTGRTPFPADLTLKQAIHMVPAPLTGVSDPIREVLEKAIAADPNDRWSAVHDFVTAFISACGRT